MKNKYYKQVAKITDTFLGFEDHGFFTTILYVDYGGCCQGIGLRFLGSDSVNGDPLRPTKTGCDYIMHTLKACGAEKWEDLKGITINVLFEEEFVLNSQPVGIEPLPFNKGERFLFSDFEKRANYEKFVESYLVTGNFLFLDEKLWVPGWKHK